MIERELIKKIAARALREHPSLVQGIGDDCAVFNNIAGKEWLISTDMLVQGVHFDTSWHEPYLLGRKSLAVNISDIAAMGGRPQFALLSVGIPGSYGSEWAEGFLEGVLAILDEYGCVLIGGDTVSAKDLTISVTVLGSADQGRSILRDGASPGDSVFVSGNLGSSSAGLYLCRNGHFNLGQLQDCRWPKLIMAHLDPVPRVELAELLLESGLVTSMQDISDGVATDLSHICTAGNVSAIIEEKDLPADPELGEMCKHLGLNLPDFQLKGGEDYELVFTVKKGCLDAFETFCRGNNISSADRNEKSQIPPVTKIGEIQAGRGVQLRRLSGELVNIEYQGYEHTS